MKVGGVAIDGPKQVILVLPRDNGDLVFKFVAVSDDEEFDKIFPAPEPPKTFITAEQRTSPDYNDEDYKRRMIEHRKARNAWVFLKSIAPSNIEWDLVKLHDPNTFDLWDKDFRRAGLSINEINRIWAAFNEANIVSDEMLNEARNRFLASQVPVPSATP